MNRLSHNGKQFMNTTKTILLYVLMSIVAIAASATETNSATLAASLVSSARGAASTETAPQKEVGHFATQDATLEEPGITIGQGIAAARFYLGIRYLTGDGVEKDETQAVQWFQKAAGQENADAQYWLGRCYLTGVGVEKDPTQAIQWFQKAADQENADAQFWLGLCYLTGEGVEKDESQAVRWFQKAAEQGHAEAQFNLGECYRNGVGIESDLTNATEWYRKAAEQGVADAQFDLGIFVELTKGEDSIDEAGEWLRKAENQGHSGAKRFSRNRRILFFVGWPILILASIFRNTLGRIAKGFLFRRSNSEAVTDESMRSGKRKNVIRFFIKTIGAAVIALCCCYLIFIWTASPYSGLYTGIFLFFVLVGW